MQCRGVPLTRVAAAHRTLHLNTTLHVSMLPLPMLDLHLLHLLHLPMLDLQLLRVSRCFSNPRASKEASTTS